MLDEALETKKEELAIAKQDVDVLIGNDVFLPLILQLPPMAELSEIKNLFFSKVSADEIYGHFNEASKAIFRIEKDRLLKKYDLHKRSPTFLSHLATLTEFSGDLNEAVNFLRSGAEVDPTTLHMQRLGRAFMVLNNFEAAERTFSAADLRRNAEANLGLACLALLQRNYSEASKFVNQALDIDPTNFSALLLGGVLELSSNRIERAIRYFRSAIEERTDSSAPYVLLGTTYSRSGRSDKALDMFKRAVAINPIDENAVILYADALFGESLKKVQDEAKRRCYEQIVTLLEDFTKFIQKSVAAWDRLGRAFYHLGKSTDALNALKHQASILENGGVWNNIALVHWKMGDFNRASNYLSLSLTKTIEEGFPTFLPFYNLFLFFRYSGQLEEAVRITEMIPKDRIRDLVKTPVASSILALRCEALAELGRIDDAERELDALLNATDVNRELHLSALQSATFFYSLVKPHQEKALYCAQMALDEIDNGGIAEQRLGLLFNNVVFVFIEFGKMDRADQLIAKLSRWIHKSATATATLGLMHLRKGHLEIGRRFYMEAISLADPRLKSRLKLKLQLEAGKVLLQQGQSRAAARCLKEAATSDLRGIQTQAAGLLRTLTP